MNQTRTFLIFAWMMVAVLLWMEWGKDSNPAPAPVESAQQQVPPSAGALPGMAPGSDAGIPAAKDAGIPSARPVGSTGAPAAAVAVAPIASDHRVTITSDVLTLSLDGGNVFDAQLLQYPQTREPDSPPVKLLDDDPAHYYIARSGWIGQGGAAGIPARKAAGSPSARPCGSTGAPAAACAVAPIASDHRVTITSDVLTLSLDGGNVFDAQLLQYPQTREPDSPPVKLLDDDPAHYYIARSGWIGQGGTRVPELVPEDPQQREIDLTTGQPTVQVSFVSPPGAAVRIRRIYTLSLGSYAIAVHDEVLNDSGQPWQGYIYRQLARIPPDAKRGVTGMTNPESYSFAGAKWFSAADGYEGRKYDDFIDDGPLDKTVTGGWVALLQHHFFTAWIPQKDQAARFGLTTSGQVHGIHAMGPSFTLAPGEKAVTNARLWVGPKLVSQLAAQDVPGLERAVDYSRFQLFAVLGQGLFWVLAKLHALFGNWGWAIIAMVCLLKPALFPLSQARSDVTTSELQ